MVGFQKILIELLMAILKGVVELYPDKDKDLKDSYKKYVEATLKMCTMWEKYNVLFGEDIQNIGEKK